MLPSDPLDPDYLLLQMAKAAGLPVPERIRVHPDAPHRKAYRGTEPLELDPALPLDVAEVVFSDGSTRRATMELEGAKPLP